jgi:hypothetical protein
MYRDDGRAKLDFEAELRVVPSPRREARVVGRIAFSFVALWAVACSAWYLLLRHHKITFGPSSNGPLVSIVVALVLVLFFPLLPVRSLVRRLLTREHRGTVQVKIDGAEVTWTGRAMPRVQRNEIDGYLSVRIGSRSHVAIATAEADVPFLLNVPDERTAHLLAIALKVDESSARKFGFPVWTGEGARPGRGWERGSLALLLAGFSALVLIASLFGPWTSFGVLLFVGPVALIAGLYLFLRSWEALLEEQPSKRLTVDASQVSLDGTLLCSHTDQITLRIVEGAGLEIAAPQIIGGTCLIKPWEPDNFHEIELIKATIESCRAQVSEEASG